jgi:hypothetical protein
MKSEDWIFLVFVGLFLFGLPLFAWLFHQDEKRQREEERNRWKNKNK